MDSNCGFSGDSFRGDDGANGANGANEPNGADRTDRTDRPNGANMPNDPRRAEELRHLEQVKLNARVAEWEFKGAGWMEYLKEVAAKFGMTWEAVKLFFDNYYQEEDIPKDPIERERALLYLRKNSEIGRPPKWLGFSGLWAPTEPGLSIVERRQRLQNLYRVTKALMRESIHGKFRGLEGAEDERTIYWEPTGEVCKMLEISQSKLTQLIKEYSGSNLPKLADEVRGEKVMARMRAEIQFKMQNSKFKIEGGSLRSQKLAGGTPAVQELGASFSQECWDVWKRLKSSRKAPEFSRDEWARGYGFANSKRMYRACIVVYKMTPQQMEMALIEEWLRKVRENEG